MTVIPIKSLLILGGQLSDENRALSVDLNWCIKGLQTTGVEHTESFELRTCLNYNPGTGTL